MQLLNVTKSLEFSAASLTATNKDDLPCLLVCYQRPILKRGRHRETALHLEEHSWPQFPGPPSDTTQTESNSPGSTDIVAAHGIPLLLIQIYPDNLSTRCILVLENCLPSHPVSQLKIANAAKQTKLLWRWGITITPTAHTAIHNVQPRLPFYCRFPFQRGSWSRCKHLNTRVGRASGQWRQCDVLAPSSPCTCIKIRKESHPSGAARTGTLIVRPPSALPSPPSLGPCAAMKLIQVSNFYQSKRFAIFICITKCGVGGEKSVPFKK